MRSPPGHLAFRLYRRAREPDKCCAVLEDGELPPVLDRNEWAPAEILEAHQVRPPGFNESAAEYACAVQGFYFFHWSGKRRTAAPER
jgi:hypothetical protein